MPEQPLLDSIAVSKADIQIIKGNSANLSVTANYTDGSSKDVTAEAAYSVSADNIVSVDKGTITATHAGTVTITVTYGNHTAAVNVTVTEQSGSPEDPGKHLITLLILSCLLYNP